MSALQKQYDGQVNIMMVNVDAPDARPFLSKYHVRSTPTFVLFDKHGRVAQSFSGWPGSPAVARAFDQLVEQN